ncbi:hypothetical protein SBD_4812 [Streptomyces bottropensis ATCC 25435]|uniref:Uncharacterized protein n=1 Tax=Streptomyces bottropensis ATCC 25435 TaxID=1054862 RepID=M3EVX1_9ACTN|nr:hypothetical protein SBD_4812 [Streptomyces bottropensis ATCC 25435]
MRGDSGACREGCLSCGFAVPVSRSTCFPRNGGSSDRTDLAGCLTCAFMGETLATETPSGSRSEIVDARMTLISGLWVSRVALIAGDDHRARPVSLATQGTSAPGDRCPVGLFGHQGEDEKLGKGRLQSLARSLTVFLGQRVGIERHRSSAFHVRCWHPRHGSRRICCMSTGGRRVYRLR